MKKILVFCFVVFAVLPSFAESDTDFTQQKNLGRDRAGLQWYILSYGSHGSGWYVVAREYYTSDGAKSETVGRLSMRYGVPSDRATELYFTEYRFEYTSDGMQYAEISRKYYDKLGEEICGYEPGYSTYYPVALNTVQSKGVAYAMGKIQ